MSGAAAAEEAREGCLFGTVARLQGGGSTSGRHLSDGCREAGKLIKFLQDLEDQEGTLLSKIQEGHSLFVEVRRNVSSTEREASTLSSKSAGSPGQPVRVERTMDGGGGGGGAEGGKVLPTLTLAEDLWCRPLSKEVWGSEGVEVLESWGGSGGGVHGAGGAEGTAHGGDADEAEAEARARAGRARGLVDLMRDVYSQENRLVHLRAQIRDENLGGEPPFKVDWVSSADSS